MRALGAAGALAWALLALVDRSMWPLAGVVTLAVAVACAVAWPHAARAAVRAMMAPSGRVFVGACALAAAAASWWFVRTTLRGEPMSIDAGVHLMQARAMAHGHFGVPPPAPETPFSARFLVEGPDRRLYGVFPPGFPLALVPFVWIGAPMMLGPMIAAAMVVAQAALGRAVARATGDEEGGESGEVATRASLVLALPSYARAVETGDLCSHALVGVLAAVAVALAIGEGEQGRAQRTQRARRWRWIAIGACVGWAVAARMLDGAVVAGVVAVALVVGRAQGRAWGWVAIGAVPFLALLAVEQRVATGEWMMPTQTLYFQRSDWPPTCHRLGLGADIGCTVEHHDEVKRLPHGYGWSEALRVTHERASVLGEDLLGFSPLALLAFAAVVASGAAADAIAAAFVLALTFAYALFYYGNGAYYGARHLFPAAPFVWLLVARAAGRIPHRAGGWLSAGRGRAASVVALLATAWVCARGPWSIRGRDAASYQAERPDLRRTMALRDIDRGILMSHDVTSVLAAFDPWTDGDDRIVVLDDGSGVSELRRAHPDLPLFTSVPVDDVGRFYRALPPDEARVELERAWPAYLRPSGSGARSASRDAASGGAVLYLSHAQPGASVAIEIGIARAGDYDVRVDALTGPSDGDWSLDLDGAPLPAYRGFATEHLPVRGDAARRTLSAGRHVLVARCTGRDERSSAYDAELDALVGAP